MNEVTSPSSHPKVLTTRFICNECVLCTNNGVIAWLQCARYFKNYTCSFALNANVLTILVPGTSECPPFECRAGTFIHYVAYNVGEVLLNDSYFSFVVAVRLQKLQWVDTKAILFYVLIDLFTIARKAKSVHPPTV